MGKINRCVRRYLHDSLFNEAEPESEEYYHNKIWVRFSGFASLNGVMATSKSESERIVGE